MIPQSWSLPTTASPTPCGTPGVTGWRTEDGIACLRVHYSADPKAADPAWVAWASTGYIGGAGGKSWKREMEIDFSSFAGDPVYGDTGHIVADDKMAVYNNKLPLLRGWDFGYRHPAITFFQWYPTIDVLTCLGEHYPTKDPKVDGVTVDRLAKQVVRLTTSLFGIPEKEQPQRVKDFCDPSGSQASDKSERTSIDILAMNGIEADYIRMGRKDRISILRRYIEVPEKFFISTNAPLTLKAIQGGYRLPERGHARDPEMPDTSAKVQGEPYIHLIDSMEYMAACHLPRPGQIGGGARTWETATLPGQEEERYQSAFELALALTPQERAQKRRWEDDGNMMLE